MNNKPLVPEYAMQYFSDSSDFSYPTYMRVIGIRNCLEAIVNTIFIYFTDKTNQKKWIEQTTLDSKIQLAKDYFSYDIFTKINNLRLLGNRIHPGHNKHKDLTHEEINSALDDVGKICEWIISEYLKKYGFNTNSWIPTMLSTLPPYYRINILEEIFDYFKKDINRDELVSYLDYVQISETMYSNKLSSGKMSFEEYKEITSKPLPNQEKFSQILLIIDKLAMSYLKNKDFNKSIEFINLQYEENMINRIFKEEMIEKLGILQNQINNLPIAQNLEQTKINFKEILQVVKKEEYSLFITIFTAIVAEEELHSNCLLVKNTESLL